jgi:hypothetical protein
MTEQQWRRREDLPRMLKFLRSAAGGLSRRKDRLFRCACCRRLGPFLSGDEIWKVLDAAERHAEGKITDATAEKWYRRADRAQEGCPERYFGVAWKAFEAVKTAILSSRYGASQLVYEEVAGALADAAVGGDRTADGLERYRRAKAAAMRDLLPLLLDVAGDPSCPVAVRHAWRTPDVTALAEAAYAERVMPAGELDRARLAVLADALEEAGCDEGRLLLHLRSAGPHVRGCWAVDAILDRE